MCPWGHPINERSGGLAGLDIFGQGQPTCFEGIQFLLDAMQFIAGLGNACCIGRSGECCFLIGAVLLKTGDLLIQFFQVTLQTF